MAEPRKEVLDQEDASDTVEGGLDEQGVPYSEYPGCPSCPDEGHVGRSHIGFTWYCYKCCRTF